MFRLPVFGILLTAVLLSLPGPAGASFAVTEYAPVLSRLYKDKQSPLASSYRISFDKSKSSAPCLTAYTLTGTAAELIRYDCTRLPADNIFSRSRSENDGSLKELAAVFNGLRHNNDDKPGIALVNDGTIDKIYADFINNASGTAFGQSVFYNRGFVKELNGDFVGSRLNNRNPERPLAAGAAVVNAAAGSISLVNVNVTDNRLNNPGGTENSIWLNAGSVSRMNAVFAGNRVRGDFGSSAVLLNTGSLTSVKGIFSANSVNGEKAAAGGAVLNEGRIDLIEADFVDKRRKPHRGHRRRRRPHSPAGKTLYHPQRKFHRQHRGLGFRTRPRRRPQRFRYRRRADNQPRLHRQRRPRQIGRLRFRRRRLYRKTAHFQH